MYHIMLRFTAASQCSPYNLYYEIATTRILFARSRYLFKDLAKLLLLPIPVIYLLSKSNIKNSYIGNFMYMSCHSLPKKSWFPENENRGELGWWETFDAGTCCLGLPWRSMYIYLLNMQLLCKISVSLVTTKWKGDYFYDRQCTANFGA